MPLLFAAPSSATEMTFVEAKAALVLAQQEVLDATAALEAATELATTSEVARDTAQTAYNEAEAAWTASKVTTPGTTSMVSQNVVLNGTFDDASNWTSIGMGTDQTLMNSNIPRVYNGVLVGSYNYDFVLQVGNFPSPTRQVTFSYDMSNNNNNLGNRPQADGYRVEFRTYNAAGQRLNYYDTRNRADSFPWTHFKASYTLPDDAVRWDIGFRLIDNGYWNGNFAGSIDNVSLTTQVATTSPETYSYGEAETSSKNSAYEALGSAKSSLSSAIITKAMAETRLATANAEVIRLTQLVADLTPRLNMPTGLVANIVSDKVELSWTAPESNTSGVQVERYAIMWSTTNFTTNGWAWAHDQASVSIPLSILESTGGLGNTFQFSIRADNDTLRIYSDRSTYASVVTVAPTTPEPIVIPIPQPEPIPQPTPEPPVEPEPEPMPEPEQPIEPVPAPEIPSEVEPEAPAVEQEPQPEPTPEIAPEVEEVKPEEPVTEEEAVEEILTLMETAPEDLTDAEVEQLVEAALIVFETAEQGSEEYNQALEALAVAAEADDPEIPSELAAIPLLGDVAGAALEALNNLGNVGADMSPQVRETAEETVIATVIAAGAAINAVGAATAATTSGSSGASGGTSGGSSGSSARRKE